MPTKDGALRRKELLAILRGLHTADTEDDHGKADDALLEYINDQEITLAYNAIHKWHA